MTDHTSHDWEIAHKEPLEVEYGTISLVEECTYVEIKGSYHSEKHDEIFYDEGAECASTRRTRYNIVVHYMGDKIDVNTDMSAAQEELFGDVASFFRDSVENGEFLPRELEDSPSSHTVELEGGQYYEGGEYYVEFEKSDQIVHEDWR